ncbi:DNA primase [Bacillus sp. DNRA2]|uniref:DNA primase n=1 Tax=Bacillus sp. DNRA2 TaxID=2723053 RepID=UPI00145E186E|nr:DNA primase [Bacillus sp. DNRA2]NMD71881.1 DNA primase [Bacillus sp. DNRA2]
MAEMIAEEKINQIRQTVDIVDVISEYIQLKKQGRNYFGLCPFHGENSPSFSVSPDKQIFHCFGCGAGGNVFTFLMEKEGLTFVEAAVRLAARAKIDLEIETNSQIKSIPKDLQLMLDAHELLRKFYHHLLVNTKEGQEALEYLMQRGFTRDSIDKFQIGYALASWDYTVKLLSSKGYSIELLEKAGLITRRERDGSALDRFRNRIMFPIFDRNGNTIAFSGRSLGGDDPKYLNSPETAIFNKSKTLYNYHLARSPMRKLQHAVLFEGFADVIAADRSDVVNGVATMGTSLTEDHVEMLRRNCQTITICYDSDNAGIEAAFRAGTMLSNAGLNVLVAMMPDGFDPDDYIKKFGGEKFSNDVIGASVTFMSFKFLYFRRGKNLQHEGERLLYIEEVLREISKLEKAVERDIYVRQIANEFSLSLDALIQQLDSYRGRNNRENSGNQAQPVRQQQLMVKRPTQQLKPAYHNAERHLLAHMLKDNELAFKVQSLLSGNTLNIDEHQAIFTYLLGYYEEGNPPDSSLFINFIQDERLRRIVTDIEMMLINDELTEKELSDYIKQVLNYQKMLKIKEKEAERTEAERQNDFLKAARLAMDIIQLRKSL